MRLCQGKRKRARKVLYIHIWPGELVEGVKGEAGIFDQNGTADLLHEMY